MNNPDEDKGPLTAILPVDDHNQIRECMRFVFNQHLGELKIAGAPFFSESVEPEKVQ